MTQQIIDTCTQATQVNYEQPLRSGNIVTLPPTGNVILTGDVHGHRRNFERVVTKADLQNNPDKHVILQEIIHGGPEDEFQGCLSFHLFFDILSYQMQFPKQVHLIMGNHDTAVINDLSVLKVGREMNQALKSAMQRYFEQDFDAVYRALKTYLLSQPLAVKTQTGLWMSHSLPANRYVPDFDTSIFETKLTAEELARSNPAYLMTWGRRHSQESLDIMAQKLGVKIFILGHQPQESGWAQAGDNLLILASDHNHGCFVTFDLDTDYTVAQLAERIVPLASIA